MSIGISFVKTILSTTMNGIMNPELRQKPAFAQSLHNFTKVDSIRDSLRTTGDAPPVRRYCLQTVNSSFFEGVLERMEPTSGLEPLTCR
ncbi:MAG: hypothetical protein WBX04_12960, partial [Candidatus Sulfotelmatobacter sp.]